MSPFAIYGQKPKAPPRPVVTDVALSITNGDGQVSVWAKWAGMYDPVLVATLQEDDTVEFAVLPKNSPFKTSTGGYIELCCGKTMTEDDVPVINFTNPQTIYPINGGANRGWGCALSGCQKTKSVRLVALNTDGSRVKDGHFIKFKTDGTAYLYHTINPTLGLDTDRNGRLRIAD